MSTPQPPVWFITGCSSGFGLELALLALHSGHHVIATSRTPSKTSDLVSSVRKLGGTWLEFDVCSPIPTVEQTIKEATAIHGKIDILVNNAAYALLGAFETMSDEECRAQFETNFFGPLNIIRAIIPQFRTQKSGTIVNISSTAGIEAKPSRSMYSGSKFALEALSEALYHELAPLGIRVLIVSPGAFRSRFSTNLVLPKNALPVEYTGTVMEQVLTATKEYAKASPPPGDVKKGVKAIFDVVMGEGQGEGMGEWLRLPLGKDGAARWVVKMDGLRANLDATESIWRGTDVDE